MLYLVDFSNLRYRFRSTIASIVTDKETGLPINRSELIGFTRLIRDTEADRIVFCLDGFPELFRHYFPQYKQTRDHEFKESLHIPLYELITLCMYIADMYSVNLTFAFKPNHEADQVISTIVHMYDKYLKMPTLKPNLKEDALLSKLDGKFEISTFKLDICRYNQIAIATTDSDIYQLLSFENVYIDRSYNGTDLTDEQTPNAVLGVSPKQIPVVKSLVGDTSDNIPSLIPKTNIKFIKHIISYLSDIDKLKKFIQDIELKNETNEELDALKKILLMGDNLTLIKKIIKTTHLVYYGTPYVFTGYDEEVAKRLIKKYKMKI